MSIVKAIKTFFETDGGRKVEISEFKALSADEKLELATMCAAALGVELEG